MTENLEKQLKLQGLKTKNFNRKNSCPKTIITSINSPTCDFIMNETDTTQSPIMKCKESFISNNSKFVELSKNNIIYKPMISSSVTIMTKKNQNKNSQIKNHMKSMKQKEEEWDKFNKILKNQNNKKGLSKKIREENNNNLAKVVEERQKKLEKNKQLVKERRENYKNSMDKKIVEKKLKLAKINQEIRINKQINKLVLHEYHESVINANKAKCSKIAQEYNEYKLKKKQKELKENKHRNKHNEHKKKLRRNLSECEIIENQYIEKFRKRIKMKEEMKRGIYFSGNNSRNNSASKFQNSFNDSGDTSIEKGKYDDNNYNTSHFLCECKNPEKKKYNYRQNSFSTFSSSQIDK